MWLFQSDFDNQQAQIAKTEVSIIFTVITLPLLCDCIVAVMVRRIQFIFPLFLPFSQPGILKVLPSLKLFRNWKILLTQNRLHFGNESTKLQSTKEMNIV